MNLDISVQYKRYLKLGSFHLAIAQRFCSIQICSEEYLFKGEMDNMKVGEVCLMTNDVIRLSNFYKKWFNIDNGSDDTVHQFIISEETTLTVYNDGLERKTNTHNICISFTVDDVDSDFERLKALGIEIVEPPMVRPWGAKNMSFLDPDKNLITFRCFL